MIKLLLFACALFGFMACTQNPIEEQSAIRVDAPETIKVGFEDDETRIQLNSAQKTVWTKEDLVSVFYRSDANQKWQYQGETGERVGNLKRVEDAIATTQTTKTVVVYPYSKNYWLNTDNYAIDATLPATQYYAEGSYGVGSNLMVSQSEFTQFSLKSVCGWLKLQLTGNGAVVKSIKFRGNDGEQVAGLIYVDTATAKATLASEMGGTDDNNAGGNLVFDDTILTEVVLDCGEGVELGAEATPFYISLPPQTFANGFTVEIECEDYELMTLTTEKELVIERNHIQPMASVEHNAEQIIPNNEIWYTNNSTTYATAPANTDAFGANIISNTYDAAKECWVIKFDGDVTSVGFSAFYQCSNLTSVVIPDGVTSIGDEAFLLCSNLTSVSIPDNVTEIGGGAFALCFKLQKFDGKIASEDGRCLILNGVLHAFAPDGITEYTIPNGVTTIENSVFYGCDSLTSVTISNNVTTIEDSAFGECSSLTSITIPDSVTTIGGYAFRGCSSLTSVTIGDSVTSIGEWAFEHCSSLTSVTIPDSVTTIGNWAFGSCSSLTSVTIPDSVTTIGYAAFISCSSLTSVYCKATTPPTGDDYMFEFNAEGRKIYVPMGSVEAYKSASGWKKYAFGIVGYDFENGVVVTPKPANNEIWYTNGSTTKATTPYKTNAFGANIVSNTYDAAKECWVITFDGDVTTIGDYAFRDCSSLTSVTIPDSVTKIGYYAFGGCSSLTSVTIPDSLTTIGYDAFCGCKSLTNVTIPDSVTTIGLGAFSGCRSLTSVTIPDSVTSIGDSAFWNCSSLTSVTIPDSVTTIGDMAFAYCSRLTKFNGKFASEDGRCLIIDGTLNSFAIGCGATEYTIPDSVTTIGISAFEDCSSLRSVAIPDSVTTIGISAFADCSSLKKVYCKAVTPPAGGYGFYNNASGLKIYVPTGSVEAYKSSEGWSEYADAIEGYNF